MKYQGKHKREPRIDWRFNRPIIHAELHTGVYLMLFLGIIFH